MGILGSAFNNYNINSSIGRIDTIDVLGGHSTPYKLLVPCSMDNGYDIIDSEKVTSLLNKLNDKASEGIKFDPQYLDYHHGGGVCSAHSLTFISDFLRSNITPLKDRVVTIAQKFKESTLEFRTYQAALNTISKINDDPPKDFMRSKIESLAGLHDLIVDYASKEEVLAEGNYYESENEVERANFYNVVETLPEGIFLIRAILKEDNHKGEHYGHSMLYINYPEGKYFFDPTDGCSVISSTKVKEALWDLVGSPSSAWGLNHPRFYRMKIKEVS